jgi:SAM-dependent methyltransferase
MRGMSDQERLSPKPELSTGDFSSKVALFDRLAQVYDSWFEGEGRVIFATELKAFQELSGSLPKPWLEVGVGSGRFAQALGIETGIDSSARLLQMASRRGIAVLLSRGEQQIFKAESFGSVFLIVTLCFLDSVPDVLKVAYRVLVPAGKIVLGLVLQDSPWGKFYERKKRQGHRFYKYASFYDYNNVLALLEEAGFSHEQTVSTLFQKPGTIEEPEVPRTGFFRDAGFVVIVAGKRSQPGVLTGLQR